MLRKAIGVTMLLGALAGGGPVASAAATCLNEGQTPSAMTEQMGRDAILCLINERRAENGLGPLTEEHRLEVAAQGHSVSMNRRNFFAHGDFQGRIARTGYLAGASSWAIGENLRWGSGGLGSPKSAVSAWMASAGHRREILSGRYRDIGIGVAMGSPMRGQGGNSAIYTADFGFRG
jgi:uncharacterized protein YkwD